AQPCPGACARWPLALSSGCPAASQAEMTRSVASSSCAHHAFPSSGHVCDETRGGSREITGCLDSSLLEAVLARRERCTAQSEPWCMRRALIPARSPRACGSTPYVSRDAGQPGGTALL